MDSDDEILARVQERVLRRVGLTRDLNACLAEIRELQKRRIRIERELRDMHRAAQERARDGGRAIVRVTA